MLKVSREATATTLFAIIDFVYIHLLNPVDQLNLLFAAVGIFKRAATATLKLSPSE